MTSLFTTARLEAAAKAAHNAGLDALLITPGADLRYLTGYQAMALERLICLLVPAEGPVSLIVPELEHSAAMDSPVSTLDITVTPWPETADPYDLVRHLLGETLPGAPGRLAVTNYMPAEQLLSLRDVLPKSEFGLSGDVMHTLRARKSSEEIAELAAAAAAIDRVHDRMMEWLRPGRTEREVARDIGYAIGDEGHAEVSFVIVASGSNGATPHHVPTGRLIRSGDTVVVDIGGRTPSGYCSDSTRTYAVGQPPPAFVEYYQVVYAAQQAGVAAVRPGVTAESVDAACRNVIEQAGYGAFFNHRTGHGIGMETHEEPYIVAGNQLLLESGMVFSVEPGIYLPSAHGARIEDIVVCNASGAQRLNMTPRSLVYL
ncbi:MAG TPA: Xaa-Pro peptidase family protein [Mycobacteriales bacterium]|nr:Xaa-Pro peptidase family protein [Mycobacteriales bacterium]